jgi:hypothetical protein
MLRAWLLLGKQIKGAVAAGEQGIAISLNKRRNITGTRKSSFLKKQSGVMNR